jgi:hypothetical protein
MPIRMPIEGLIERFPRKPLDSTPSKHRFSARRRYNVVERPAHINDLNATILHCLGIDHQRLTYKFQGLDARLTGVEEAQVIQEALPG